MKIELNLFASYRDYLPEGRRGNSAEFEMEQGATIKDLLDAVNLEEEKPKMIFRNSKHAKPQTPLEDGDRIAIFPPVAGG
jgi:molybdopterin converting factor small subunit